MTDEPIRLENDHVRGSIYVTGGLFTEADFRLASGRWVKPLAKAPWPPLNDPEIPGHMRRLGGEFFCLPFGGGGTVREPKPGWESLAQGPIDVPMHGPAANEDWQILEVRKDRVRLALEMPEAFPACRIEREIRLAANAPRVDVTITIEARRAGPVPAAFHPILRLPTPPKSLEILANFARGFTYPGIIEPDRMAAEPGHEFDDLKQIPGRHGGMVDLSHLPLGPPTEDVILLAGMKGPISARFVDEGFNFEIDWSRELLPHCMMWIHDRGNDASPWDGIYGGIGIEPLAAAFDGPRRLSAGPNPLARQGYATALTLSPDAPVVLWCGMSATQS